MPTPLQRRLRCLRSPHGVRGMIALTALALVLTACSIGPDATNQMTGKSTSGTASSLAGGDPSFYGTEASCDGSFGGCATEWSARFQLPTRVDFSLQVHYSGENSGAGYQFISVWNWNTMSWVAVDAFRVVATSEVPVSVTLPEPSSQWVFNGPNSALAFVKVTTIGNFNASWASYLRMCNAPCTSHE